MTRMATVRVPPTSHRTFQFCLCMFAVALGTRSVTGQVMDLKTYTRTETTSDSEGVPFTVRVPEFIPKGGFLKRGDQALFGQGWEKTLFHQENRQEVYRSAFSELAKPTMSDGFVSEWSDFDQELKKLVDGGSLAAEQYGVIKSSVQLAARGLNLKYVNGDTLLARELNRAKAELRAVRADVRGADNLNKIGHTLELALATKEFAGILKEGVDSYKQVSSRGGEMAARLDRIRDVYVSKAGGISEAKAKYPAEMRALEEERVYIEASSGLAGAIASSLDRNQGKVWSIAEDVTVAPVTMKFGPTLAAAAKGTLLKAGVSKATLASGSLAASAGLIAIAVEKKVIESQAQQGQNAQVATAYATIAMDLYEASQKTGDPEYRLMAEQATVKHNEKMVEVTGILLGRFHDAIEGVVRRQDDDPQVLDTYAKWNKHYRKAVEVGEQAVAQWQVLSDLDTAAKSTSVMVKGLSAADLLQAAAVEGKLPLSPDALGTLIRILSLAEEQGLEIPNFDILCQDPKQLGPFLQQLAKAANQPGLTREIDAWVAKPEQLAALMGPGGSSDIDEQIKRALSQARSSRSGEHGPLETDEGALSRSYYSGISDFLRHPTFTAFSGARGGFSSPNQTRPGRMGPAGAGTGYTPAGSSGPARQPTRGVGAGWSTGDMQWARQMQAAAQQGNWDRFMALGSQGIRDGRTTRVGMSVGIDAARLEKANSAAQQGINSYFQWRGAGNAMPSIRLK